MKGCPVQDSRPAHPPISATGCLPFYPSYQEGLLGGTNREPKVLFFDIESTGLNATFGTILCIGYSWLGQDKVYVPTILDNANQNLLSDRDLVKNFAEIYNQADYTVGHYAKRFDVPMIQSKLLKYKLKPLAPVPLIDTWRIVKDNFKLHSNRLITIEEFLQVAHSKTPITFDDWLQAAHGNRKALRQVVKHCRLDVLVLKEVFERIRPWIRTEPARRLFLDASSHSCPSCGSERLQARGYQVSHTRRYQRFQCQGCGRWSRGRTSETRAELV